MGCHFLLQGNLPDPGIEPTSLVSPALAREFFTTSATWEVPGPSYGSIKHQLLLPPPSPSFPKTHQHCRARGHQRWAALSPGTGRQGAGWVLGKEVWFAEVACRNPEYPPTHLRASVKRDAENSRTLPPPPAAGPTLAPQGDSHTRSHITLPSLRTRLPLPHWFS